MLATGELLELLQQENEALLQPQQTYLLFLQAHPGLPWRIFCPQRTLARVINEQVRSVAQDRPGELLWPDTTVGMLEAQI